MIGGSDLSGAEWRAVDAVGVCLVGATLTDRSPAANQLRFGGALGCVLEGIPDRVGIVTVDPLDRPASSLEAGANILTGCEIGGPFDRDVIVVIDPTQVRQLQVAGEGSGFGGDALHHAAIAAQRIGVVVEHLEARAVEASRHVSRCDRHADAGCESLAQLARGGFDARAPAVFGVACPAAFQSA